MDLMSLLAGMKQPSDEFGRQFRLGEAGSPFTTVDQPSQDPEFQQRAMAEAAAMRQRMLAQEQARWGIREQDPAVGSFMQAIEAQLGSPRRNPWVDSTGLGGRMDALAQMPSQAAPLGRPQASPEEQGLLRQALETAAGNSMRPMDQYDARSLAQQGQPSSLQGREVLQGSSERPMTAEPWYDEYLALAQSGAGRDQLPMIRGNAPTEDPRNLAKRDAYRQNRQAEMDSRQRLVQSKAVGQTAARHQRMGIPDNSMMFDSIDRLQGMQGGEGGQQSGSVGYLIDQMTGGPQYAQAAMQQRGEMQRMDAQSAADKYKMNSATAIAILQNPASAPEATLWAMNWLRSNGDMNAPQPPMEVAGGPASPPVPTIPEVLIRDFFPDDIIPGPGSLGGLFEDLRRRQHGPPVGLHPKFKNQLAPPAP